MNLENYLDGIAQHLVDLPEDLSVFGLKESELECDTIMAYIHPDTKLMTLSFIYDKHIEEISYLIPEYLPEDLDEDILQVMARCAGFEGFDGYFEQSIENKDLYITNDDGFYKFTTVTEHDNCTFTSEVELEIESYSDFIAIMSNMVGRKLYPQIKYGKIELENLYLNRLIGIFSPIRLVEILEDEPLVVQYALNKDAELEDEVLEILEYYAKEDALEYVLENEIEL